MGIYRNFDIFHSLLDLSLIFLSERETISEILIKASKFTTPRALSINKQCVPYCNVNDYLSVMKTLCIRLYRKMVETETVMNTLYI